MRIVDKIKNLQPYIFKLLSKYEHLRDDDNKLLANIWLKEIGKDNLKEMSAYDFLVLFSEGKLSNFESIGRARRKVQSENEELRGSKYKLRKEEEEYTTNNINK